MPILLDYYVKIKNNYCIQCLPEEGDKTIIVLLKLLRESITNSYPDINLYIACDKIYHSIFETQENILEKNIDKNFFSKINLLFNTKELEDFIIRSKIDIKPYKTIKNQNKKCVFYPGKILNSNEIKKIIDFIVLQNYEYQINKPWQNAGWVIGSHHESVYQAAGTGIPTTLITKEKNILFEKLFPDCDTIDLSIFDA